MGLAVLPVYRPVKLDRDYLAEKALDQFSRGHPGIWRTLSASQKMRVLEEFRDSISSLEESLAIGNPAFLIEHSCWAKVHLTALHFPKNHEHLVLVALGEVLKKELPSDFRKQAEAIIAGSLAGLNTIRTDIPSCITPANPHADVARSFLVAVIAADQQLAGKVLENAARSGIPVKNIYIHVFEPVLQETGRLWQLQQVSIAQEHFVTATIETFMARLSDRGLPLGEGEMGRKAMTVVAASVGPELHDIGIRMVADCFHMDGYDTYFIGANTPVQSILGAVQERKADVVALSTTMPRHLPDVQYLIRSLRADPGTAGVKIIVGGYPFRVVPELWKQIGADAYAGDAEEAIVVANRLMPERR
jgi:methanogenic corrinoid protein MtbC1